MSFIDDVKTGGSGGDKTPLAPGKYSDLEIVYDIGERGTKDPELFRRSFLVASDSADGTAFLSVNRKESWAQPAYLALAFDSVESAVAEGSCTDSEVNAARLELRAAATEKVEAANTPEDGVAEATDKTYSNLLMQIRIGVGDLFRLQDWKGVPRDASNFSLVGTRFTGTVTAATYNAGATSEVTSIGKKSKNTAAASAKKEAVAFP